VIESVRTLAGRYELGEVLGRGGMAEVRAGLDTRLNRRVAIKLLRPTLATDPAFRTRFRQEAQAAARMAHPTIVRVFDAGEETVQGPDGLDVQLPFIVMERVEGKLLSDLIAAGAINVLLQRGRAIPEDVAIIGFDNLGVSTSPSLTTLTNPVVAMSRTAGQMLLDLLENGDRDPQHTQFSPDLVVRESTATGGA